MSIRTGPLKYLRAAANHQIIARIKNPPTTTQVQLNDFASCCIFSSNVLGQMKKVDVTVSHTTDIQPIGVESLPKLNDDVLKLLRETVSLKRIGIAYDI